MKVHEKYKTFDVEWIANPRIDWDTKRLKYFIQGVIGGGTPSTGDAEYWRGDIPWVSSKDMKTNIIRDTEEHISARAVEESSTSRIDPGTVLMVARSGILKHTLPVAISAVPLTINQDIKAFTVEETLLARFLYWRLKGTARDILDICGKVGATVESIDIEALLSLPVSIPGLKEQTAIADYLDKETAKIDELVGKKRRLIDLLKEERLGIINRAVTRGLDPNAKLKPSNIEWIGAIPAGWETRRLGAIGRFSKGGNISRADLLFSGEGVQAILYGDLYTKYDIIVESPINRISADTARDAVRLSKGDLLFAGSGETKEDIGKCVLFNGDEPAYAGGDIIIFKQTECDGHFLSYSQNSSAAQYQKAASSKGEIVVHTYGSTLKNVVMPYPSTVEEQRQIVSYLDKRTTQIDATIAKIEKEIALLSEYRTALISEVVTGKIKVGA